MSVVLPVEWQVKIWALATNTGYWDVHDIAWTHFQSDCVKLEDYCMWFRIESTTHLLKFNYWVNVSFVFQRRGTKRRRKLNGSMGLATDKAVSIPQITYDHIDDSEEKKDVPYFLGGQRDNNEGNALEKSSALMLNSVQYLNWYQIGIKGYCHT